MAGAGFAGVTSPRHLRAVGALMQQQVARELLDRIAGSSNSPDVVRQLRRKGLDIWCYMVPCKDRDGKSVEHGVYQLSDESKSRVHEWLACSGQTIAGLLAKPS